MKKFIQTTFLLFSIILVILELAIRGLGLAGSTMPSTKINGEYRYIPGSKGIWVKGPFANISSTYSINKQGFNSVISDYKNDSNEFKIALIGDSYIEGLHVDVERSIGRTIEDLYFDRDISVHEYGISGWNVHNFIQIANEIKNEYNLIFVLITDKDLSETIKSNAEPEIPSWPRKLYSNFHTLRYLNINRGLIQRLREIGPRSIHFSHQSIERKPRYSKLNEFPANTVFLYEESNLKSFPSHRKFLKIEHIKQPKDFGKVDSHWNLNGRYNCAFAIVNYVRMQYHSNIAPSGFKPETF